MPLTHRGHEMLERLPQASFAGGSALGCEIVRHDELCVGCGKCAAACPTTASKRGESFDVSQLLDAPPDSRRGALGAALRRLQRHAPTGPITVPARVTTYRTIDYDAAACLGCGACARACPSEAIEALAPEVGVTATDVDADTAAASHAGSGATAAGALEVSS
jgi:formate hydrogenlyase subunit 6/NADH:ubiquinone oxidoreductase subunit I